MLVFARYASQLASSESVDGSPFPRNSNNPRSTGASALCCGGSPACPATDPPASAAVTTATPMRRAKPISAAVLVGNRPGVLCAVGLVRTRRAGTGRLSGLVGLRHSPLVELAITATLHEVHALPVGDEIQILHGGVIGVHRRV